MEKHGEDRLEPEVEVIHEPEPHSSSGRSFEATRPSLIKKWGIPTIVLAGLAIAGIGLWMFFPPGIFSPKKPEDSPEFKALTEAVQKLNSETTPLKNEIQTLRTEQKAIQEQLTALSEKLSVLTKKTENRTDNKKSKKSIIHKIKKGDTISSIAQKYQVQPEDIRRWNHLPPKTNPKPGRKITIFFPSES